MTYLNYVYYKRPHLRHIGCMNNTVQNTPWTTHDKGHVTHGNRKLWTVGTKGPPGPKHHNGQGPQDLCTTGPIGRWDHWTAQSNEPHAETYGQQGPIDRRFQWTTRTSRPQGPLDHSYQWTTCREQRTAVTNRLQDRFAAWANGQHCPMDHIDQRTNGPGPT